MKSRKLSFVAGLAAATLLCGWSSGQATVFLDPGVYIGDVRSPEITGYELLGGGWFWWDNKPSCASESHFQGKIGFKALRYAPQVRVASSCLINPGQCSPVRDEAYTYYFGLVTTGSDVFLYKKRHGDDRGDTGDLFDANGESISLNAGQSSRLWIEGQYLFYQEQTYTTMGGFRTRLYRVRRDGTASPEVLASISGWEFFTEYLRFTYFYSDPPYGTYRTGHLLLAEGGRLFVQYEGGVAATEIRSNVTDIAIQPPNALKFTSTIYTVENIGGAGDAEGWLYSIDPSPPHTATALKLWSGYHFLEVELAHWPDGDPGRVFIHRAIPGTMGQYTSPACYRQWVQGNFNFWEQFIVTEYEGNLKGSRDWLYYVHDSKIKGMPSDAPPQELDVECQGFEVTQGVQSYGHEAIMIAGKRTYARGYGRLSRNTTTQAKWYTGANLHGSRAGNPLPDSPLYPVDPVQLHTDTGLATQRQEGGGYLFELPESWTEPGTVTFELRLNESGEVPESGFDPNDATAVVNFVAKDPTWLKLRPLKTTVSPYYADASDSALTEILARCESMLPVARLEVTTTNSILAKPVFYFEVEWQPCPVGVCPVPVLKVRYDPFYLENANDDDRMWAIFWLGADLFTTSKPGADFHLVGTVHRDLANFTGIGGMSDMDLSDLYDGLPDWKIPNTDWTKVAAVKMRTGTPEYMLPVDPDPHPAYFNYPDGGTTLAHELGHNYGRRHVDQSSGNCGDGKPAGPYHVPPFDPCTFGPASNTNLPESVAGFDVTRLEPVRNDQHAIGDLMSYSDARWTSIWTWNAIANKIPGTGREAPGAPRSAADSWMIAKAFYDPVSGNAMLMPCEILPDGIIPDDMVIQSLDAEGQMPGEHPIEFCQLDAAGDVLSIHKAIPYAIPVEDGSPPPDQLWFIQVLPSYPEMAAITLCDGAATLAWFPRSDSPPEVTVHQPSLDADNELMHISWDAADPDGTPLLFSVYYSADDGTTWQPLANYLDTTEITVSTRLLPGSDAAKVRVIACDGLDTDVGHSRTFAVPLTEPKVNILSLPEGMRVPYGGTVRPLVFACDNEDGLLQPQWTLTGPTPSSGVGKAPTFRSLAPGDYTLSVVASDSDGMDTVVEKSFEVRPLVVPDTDTPSLDGYWADAAYDDGAKIALKAGDADMRVVLAHADDRLWVDFVGIPDEIGEIESVGIVVDTDGMAIPGQGPGSAERGFYLDSHAMSSQTVGNTTTMVEDTAPPLGFFWAVNGWGTKSLNFEFAIDQALVNGWHHDARIVIDIIHPGTGSGRTLWPAAADLNDPSTWAAARFGNLGEPTNMAPLGAAVKQIVVIASQVDMINLQGSGEDPDGDALSYSWSQVSGPEVTLTGNDTAAPSFEPPLVAGLTRLVFQLVVSDGEFDSDPIEAAVVLLPDPLLYVRTGSGGSLLAAVDIRHEGGQIHVDFVGQPETVYEIRRSENLTDWQTVDTVTAGVMGRFTYSEPLSSESRRCFYSASSTPEDVSNVVGYAGVPIPARSWALVASPFNALAPGPALSMEQFLPGAPAGTAVWFRRGNHFELEIKQHGDPRDYWSPGEALVERSTSAFVYNPSEQESRFLVLGNVPNPETDGETVLKLGSNTYNFLAYPYPLPRNFSDTALAGHAQPGDVIFLWETHKSGGGWKICTMGDLRSLPKRTQGTETVPGIGFIYFRKGEGKDVSEPIPYNRP